MKKAIRLFEYMNECDRFDLKAVVDWLQNLDCKYLIVKHDQDTPRKAHYHAFVSLENARTIKDIAKQCNTQEQYIQKIKKGFKNALAYAFHLTEGAENDGKYVYTADAVVSSQNVDIDGIFKLSKEYKEEKAHNKEIEELLYKYGECEISKAETLKRMNAKDFAKNKRLFDSMRLYRQMKVREREMDVVYITGGSGSGKTTLAKFMASIMKYDVFISGSGKDVLDGYDKEECIVLDDLRADVFTKAELFKLTDNNTNSSVKSRYANKDISYCRLMIITSVKSPKDLYNWNTINPDEKDETFKQFARRLDNKFLWIDDRNGFIYECYFDVLDYDKPTTKKRTQFTIADVFTVLGIKATIGRNLFDQITDKVKEAVEAKKDSNDTDDLPF